MHEIRSTVNNNMIHICYRLKDNHVQTYIISRSQSSLFQNDGRGLEIKYLRLHQCMNISITYNLVKNQTLKPFCVVHQLVGRRTYTSAPRVNDNMFIFYLEIYIKITNFDGKYNKSDPVKSHFKEGVVRIRY